MAVYNRPSAWYINNMENKTTIMTNINFATATKAELEAAGYTVTVRKSQMKTRRTKKSLFGVRPSMNNSASRRNAKPLAAAELPAANGKLQG